MKTLPFLRKSFGCQPGIRYFCRKKRIDKTKQTSVCLLFHLSLKRQTGKAGYDSYLINSYLIICII